MKRILFLCTGNSCRSQMAQVLMNHLGKGRFVAFSAGSKPAGYVHPLALQTLAEAHLSTEGLRSKSWDEFQGQPFDFVITVCGNAKESCPVWLRDPASLGAMSSSNVKREGGPGQPVTAHWGFEDPADAEGTDVEKKRIFQKVFMEIQTRIGLFLASPKESGLERK